MRAAITAAAFGAILLGATATAQETEDDVAEYRARWAQFEDTLHQTRLSTARWSVVFSRIDAFGESWTIISFGRDKDRPHEWPQVWGARRLVGGRNTLQQAFVTDSTSCLALRDQLAAMERLTAPRIDLPGVGRDRQPTTAVMDGDDNRLWTRFGVYDSPRRDGAVEIRGNVDTDLAAWGDQTLSALEECWERAD